jgi:uncharacterized Fe-S cluster protein YjdI
MDHPPEDPREAGVPATSGPTRVYETDEIRVLWDATRCTHVAICLNAAPHVFDVRRRPWVDIDADRAEEVAQAVRGCPTGALRYESKGDLPDEEPDEPTTIELRTNGPMYVRGRVQVTDSRGNVIVEETRIALCRCGASQNKPFCDNSHREFEFRASP